MWARGDGPGPRGLRLHGAQGGLEGPSLEVGAVVGESAPDAHGRQACHLAFPGGLRSGTRRVGQQLTCGELGVLSSAGGSLARSDAVPMAGQRGPARRHPLEDEMTADPTAPVLAKIRKLLAKAEDQAATQEAAEPYTAKAAQLNAD